MNNNINAANGITDILIDTIGKKYDNIRDLNSLNINLEEENYEAMVPVIDSIIEDENNSIGKLQQLIDLLSGSEEDIEEGKQKTIEIIDQNDEFVESITSMKKKLILSENFDNVIDDVQAVADPVFVGANEEHDENKKKYEDAIEENKKEAEETIPDEGDTGKEIKSKELKAMHLSEELFEDLSFDNYSDFNAAVYNAISEVCFNFQEKGLSQKDIEAAIKWFQTHFFDSDGLDFIEDELDEDFGDVADKISSISSGFTSTMSDLRNSMSSVIPTSTSNSVISSFNKGLNESYVAEWWGQVDGDTPQEVAKRYNLSVKPIKRKQDEILYKFEGSLEDFSRAIDDGYFYALMYKQDAGHSEDINSLLNESIQSKIAKEQIKRFIEGKMPKNWNVDSYLNKLTEKKHITKKEAKSLREWYSTIK